MKILVTGSKGFIGKNLIARLNEMDNIQIIEFDKDDKIKDINFEELDFIYHLAGVNRPVEIKEFYDGNTTLTEQIINILNNKNLKIPIVYTSSIQAVKDNDYGKSKKMAEEALQKYSNSYLFRLHNVFGKWCRPNYNSVVATFCNNIANDLDITINDPKTELELVYIDDVVNTFISLLSSLDNLKAINYIEPVYKINLEGLSKMIYSFRDDMKSINTPATGDDFTKKMFATFVSYIPIDKMNVFAKMNIDDRGSFTELSRTEHSGQYSISTSKPGIIRGNHYHHTKMERFVVVKGKARISFRKIDEEEIFDYYVDADNMQVITIPPGYTHRIENIGNDEMILFLWCNEIFDKEHPDTYACEVFKNKQKTI